MKRDNIKIQMSTFVAINDLVSAFLCVLSTLKLWAVYKENRDFLILDFLKFYLFLGVFFILLAVAVPGFLFSQYPYNNILYSLSRFFVFLAAAYFIRVPLTIWNTLTLKNIIFGIQILFALSFSTASFLLSNKITLLEISKTQYLVTPEPPLLSSLLGVFMGLTSILSIIFFIVNAFKSKERLVKIRSLLIGGGMFILLIASLITFILSLLSSFYLIAYSLSSFLAWTALLIILVGILFKKRKSAPEMEIVQI